MIIAVRGKSPSLAPGVFTAETATLIGDVRLGSDSSVWFNVVLRGDVMPIVIGSESNVQDNTVIHGTMNRFGVTIGDRVTIGHSVILHGCEVGDEVLIGMGSIVLDGVRIPPRTMVGAGSLVTSGVGLEPGHLVLGRPARAVRPLDARELEFLKTSAQNYIQYKSWYAPEGPR